MTESQITTKLMRFINRSGHYSFCEKYYGSGMTRTGTPDLLGAWDGQPFRIEVKTPDEIDTGVSLAQRAALRKAARGGYVVGVVSGLDDFLDLFDYTPQ